MSEGKLDVISVLGPDRRRSVEELANVYEDVELLKKFISDLFQRQGISRRDISGKSILIKPNWVRHCLTDSDQLCLITHPNMILAVLEVLLPFGPKSVIIGDAPVQGCAWDRLLDKGFISAVANLSELSGVEIKIIDFRRVIADTMVDVYKNPNRRADDYIIYDLGEKSLLEDISIPEGHFRVADYDPDRLAESHHKGKHLYCIAKEMFEADLIIALPKAKTHQKAGITNALKLLVGFNGDKDFLPHHRLGGSSEGGDCYPGRDIRLKIAEYFIDLANRRIGSKSHKMLNTMIKAIIKLTPDKLISSFGGSWYGNDTVWRMTLDLNMICHRGEVTGALKTHSIRRMIYISDAIVGGQGNGPLRPEPYPLGLLMASEDPLLMDRALALLMGFDPERVPLLKHGQNLFPQQGNVVKLDNGEIYEDELEGILDAAKPAPGWLGHIEKAKRC